MNKSIGFIGCGNMAQAMLGGIVSSKLIDSGSLIVSNPSENKLNFVKDKYAVLVTRNNKEVAQFSDIIFLAVKPNKYDVVIDEIKDSVKNNVVIVTIAAGIDIKHIENSFGRKIKVVRTMPNTPALVQEAMSAVTFNDMITSEEKEEILSIYNSFGKTEVIEERLMDIVPGVSGSSPAYVYMFIEALADGGVLRGMPRDKAYKMAAQAVLGAAKMVIETGKHPGQLKDEVCSPGGTTIEGVYALEKNNFRGAVISAVEKCTDKAEAMSKQK